MSECVRPWHRGPRRSGRSPRVPGDGRSTDCLRDLGYVSARAVLDRPGGRTGYRVARPPPLSLPRLPVPVRRLLLGCPPGRRAHRRTQSLAPSRPFDTPYPPWSSLPPLVSAPTTQGSEPRENSMPNQAAAIRQNSPGLVSPSTITSSTDASNSVRPRGVGTNIAAQHPNQNLATWTIWAGGPDRPTWTVTASPHIPSSLLAGLAESLAQETGTRQAQPDREHQTLTSKGPPRPQTRHKAQPARKQEAAADHAAA